MGKEAGLRVVPSDLWRDLEEVGAEQGGLLQAVTVTPMVMTLEQGPPVPAHAAAPSPAHGHPARVGRGGRPRAWWALAAGALARGLLTCPHAPLHPAARHSLQDGAASFPGPRLSPAPGILPFSHIPSPPTLSPQATQPQATEHFLRPGQALWAAQGCPRLPRRPWDTCPAGLRGGHCPQGLSGSLLASSIKRL